MDTEVSQFMAPPLGPELQHVVFGHKPAYLTDGPSSAVVLFEQLAAEGSVSDRFVSVKVEIASGALETLLVNKANFAALVEQHPAFFEESFGITEADWILGGLKDREPARLAEEILGVLLGYGVYNSRQFEKQLRGLTVPLPTPLPWEGSVPADRLLLVEPPVYQNWPSYESRALSLQYMQDNMRIEQFFLRKHQLSQPPTRPDQLQAIQKDMNRTALKALLTPAAVASRAHG